jgi:hypothetical protein
VKASKVRVKVAATFAIDRRTEQDERNKEVRFHSEKLLVVPIRLGRKERERQRDRNRNRVCV